MDEKEQLFMAMVVEGIIVKSTKTEKGEQLWRLTDKFLEKLKDNLLEFSAGHPKKKAYGALVGAIILTVTGFAAPEESFGITVKGIQCRADIVMGMIEGMVKGKK